ncbi:Homoserine O-acetyltransferase [Pleurostoma richardsiae]|uniref:Homoserine O-acetyltransferase n=1 Tax=Pleurostoma richardsiae TaxID=41990 RepID=A0AA38VEU2_9PEZI|nr:Homoserine O-acetyltransferase [Pleurostoma richardsiae]
MWVRTQDLYGVKEADERLVLDHDPDPSNIYAQLIAGQSFASIPSLHLECGDCLEDCTIAYKTWGQLNNERDNVLVICHALSGSADASDWWSPLIGPGRAFDPEHFFIFCGNVLGSPYGSASPLAFRGKMGVRYGADFPPTTIRDDVRAHKLVLDALGVNSVAAVVGGSMGGMTALEWPLCTSPGYVKSLIPIATAADHSAWGISWAETQRQCIYADPTFRDGDYEPTPATQPSTGLAAARMVAMLTYRSCASFDSRFGRRPPRPLRNTAGADPLDLPRTDTTSLVTDKNPGHGRPAYIKSRKNPSFSAQGYLYYQGEKFVKRFDANCYLHLTNKMDSHDLTRGRADKSETQDEALRRLLSRVPSGALVIGVETDALFLPEQQNRLAACLPDASLSMLRSADGHDGFLLEFEQLDELIQRKLRREYPGYYETVLHSDQTCGSAPLSESLTGEVENW